jgi:23S rRNA (cytidine1920-2'-O)/16S rRNA (cytidine1409-2'-O)-methyltransferase
VKKPTDENPPQEPTRHRPKKARADQLVVEQGLAESRQKAQALILAGHVLAGDTPVKKPGESLDAAVELRLKGNLHPYASRGGLKLEHALKHFALSPAGKIALDVGASTGGFTSCLLLSGAARVYAIDVGHNQLAWSLRQDPRVISMEGVNARYLEASQLPEPIGFLTCDVSFISLRLILPALARVATPGAEAVLLIKPQFEVGPREVGPGGVVRDAALHERVCQEISAAAEAEGFEKLGLTPSPILGPAGNREFLLAARRAE